MSSFLTLRIHDIMKHAKEKGATAKQKEKLCKSDFVSLTGAKEKTSKG